MKIIAQTKLKRLTVSRFLLRYPNSLPPITMSSVTYDSRSKTHPTTVGRALLEVMSTKKSNLAFSADIHDTDSFLAMCDGITPCLPSLRNSGWTLHMHLEDSHRHNL